MFVLDHGGAAIRDVLDALAESSFTIDQLAVRCGLSAAKAASTVSDLEVEGLARRVEGGQVPADAAVNGRRPQAGTRAGGVET